MKIKMLSVLLAWIIVMFCFAVTNLESLIIGAIILYVSDKFEGTLSGRSK